MPLAIFARIGPVRAGRIGFTIEVGYPNVPEREALFAHYAAKKRCDTAIDWAGAARMVGPRHSPTDIVQILDVRVEGLTTSATEVAGVLRAGTLLRTYGISGYVDWGCAWPGVGDHVEFELPGGMARVTLETHEVTADTRDIDGPRSDDVRWSGIMAAAVIVPASHPFARDSAPVAAALERIEEAAAPIAHTAAAS